MVDEPEFNPTFFMSKSYAFLPGKKCFLFKNIIFSLGPTFVESFRPIQFFKKPKNYFITNRLLLYRRELKNALNCVCKYLQFYTEKKSLYYIQKYP